MKKLALFLLPVFCFGLMQYTPKASKQKWTIDQKHSKITFNVTHLLVSEVEGYFHDFSGEAETNIDGNWTNPKINLVIKTASIDTDNEHRDEHLKSDDFFDVQKFPEMKFKSTSMKKVDDKMYKLKGYLTIKGITKEVELDAKYGGQIDDPQDGMTKAGFKITGDIDRYDFGLKWNMSPTAEITAVDRIVHLKCFVRLERPTVRL